MKKTCLTMSMLLVACSSMSVGNPKKSVAQSDAAIRGAQQSGAENVQPAAEQLALAEAQREEAKHVMARGDYFDAYYLGRRAQADAELATALANEAKLDQRTDVENESSGPARSGQ
jgi:hypothetical protein